MFDKTGVCNVVISLLSHIMVEYVIIRRQLALSGNSSTLGEKDQRIMTLGHYITSLLFVVFYTLLSVGINLGLKSISCIYLFTDKPEEETSHVISGNGFSSF